jgi:4-hydroxy-tetrahydrodipicolinate synthase
MKTINGIIPVMVTPFTDDNKIDYDSLDRLIEWYIGHGVDALFAVCQSSEMIFLSLEERVALSEHVVKRVNKRIPVISSGHISDDLDEQKRELVAMSKTGADALVLVTNHLDPQQQGSETFYRYLNELLDVLPADLPLGIYECPVPYRRLLSDDEISYCANTGRFVVIKDVSCDLATVQRRVALVEGTPLSIVNANAAIAYPAMLSGARGFCGVMANFHPELYVWLQNQGQRRSELADEVARFLSLSALVERYGYPNNAKIYLQQMGIVRSTLCRVNKDDVLKTNWALDVVLDQIRAGTESYKEKVGVK